MTLGDHLILCNIGCAVWLWEHVWRFLVYEKRNISTLPNCISINLP